MNVLQDVPTLTHGLEPLYREAHYETVGSEETIQIISIAE